MRKTEDELEKEFNRKYGPAPEISDDELLKQAMREALAHKAKLLKDKQCR